MDRGHPLRRKYKRYRLEAPMIFSWKDARGLWHEDVGLTRDMSPAGTFVTSKSAPPLHTAIRFEVALPGQRTAGTPLLIRSRGRVVRVELPQGKNLGGFAVAGKLSVIRRTEERR